jgi:hypothetical protein
MEIEELRNKVTAKLPAKFTGRKELVDEIEAAKSQGELAIAFIKKYGWNKEKYPDWLKEVEREFPIVS